MPGVREVHELQPGLKEGRVSEIEFRNNRAVRGSVLVGEIYPPMVGGIDSTYWYKSLITGAKGKQATLAEAKAALKEQLARELRSRSAAPPPAPAPARPSARGRQARSRAVECERCGIEVPNLPVHLREFHGVVQPIDITPRPRRRIAPLPGLVKCPKCSADVSPRNLDRHLKKVHGAKRTPLPAKPSAPAGTSASVSPSNSTKSKPSSIASCPECGGRVLKSELASHVAKHKSAAAREQRSRAPRQRLQSASKTRASGRKASAGDPQRAQEKRLDGTRDYDQRYRERGRFGSASSYDDYGDESQP